MATRLNGSFVRSYDVTRAEERLGNPPNDRVARAEWRARGPVLTHEAKSAPASGGGSSGRVHPELVLDDSNLLPFAFLRTGDRVGRAVVKIERADGAAATGFLVAPRILLTNHHVLPDVSTASGARVLANYESPSDEGPADGTAIVPLDPETLFVTHEELDFTFCGINGLEHLGTIPARRDSRTVLPSDYVNIIQHPSGRPKEVALQDSRVLKLDHVVVHYCCDTEPGSSGSPVFNNQWKLVAIHHASVVTELAQGGRKAVGMGPDSWYLNEGVRLSAIALWLESEEAHAPHLMEQTARLREIFIDVDEQVGYFGALGHRAAGRTAAEVVLDAYRGAQSCFDVAFWSLSGINDRFMNHLADLGWVIAGMNLDLWCLAGLAVEDARMLCEHLDSCYRIDCGLLVARDESSGRPIAVLYRRTRVHEVHWLSSPSYGQPRRATVRLSRPGGAAARFEIVPLLRDPGRFACTHAPLLDDLVSLENTAGASVLVFSDDPGLRDMLSAAPVCEHAPSAIGSEGGFVLRPDPGLGLRTVFVSPNLEEVCDAAGTIRVARDRRWPQSIEAVPGPRPLAIRLTIEDPEMVESPSTKPKVAALYVPPRLEPDLERALRKILAQYGSLP